MRLQQPAGRRRYVWSDGRPRPSYHDAKRYRASS